MPKYDPSQPTQTTPTGYVIPIPSREAVEDALRRLAQPVDPEQRAAKKATAKKAAKGAPVKKAAKAAKVAKKAAKKA